jgi:HEAT repeat protein
LESSALIWDVAGLLSQPPPALAMPTDADLRRWLVDLGDEKPGEGYKAVWRFVAAPEQALPFLGDCLRPIKAPEPAAVARLLGDLDSADFQNRERASRELGKLGETVVNALRKARKDSVSAEQSRRIDRLLVELVGPAPGPEQLRAIRAVAVLEQIGAPQAEKILTAIAAGAAGTRLTEEATAALERLKRTQR